MKSLSPLLLAAALVVVFLASQGPPPRFLGMVQTDSGEYLGGAVSLLETGAYEIPTFPETQKPRFPPGFSLLLAAVIRSGVPLEIAPFFINRIVGLIGPILLFFLMRNRSPDPVPGVAALMLATLPPYLTLVRAPIGDLSGASLCLVALTLIWLWAREGKLFFGVLGAALLGISVSFRLPGAFLFVLFPALAWAKRSWREPTALFSTASFCLLPLLLFQAQHHGNPLKTGYEEVAIADGYLHFFSPRFVPRNLSDFFFDFAMLRPTSSVAIKFGTGFWISPLLLLTAAVAFWERRRDRITLAFLGAGIFYGLCLLSYYFPGTKLFGPLHLFLVPLAATFLLSRKALRIVLVMACLIPFFRSVPLLTPKPRLKAPDTWFVLAKRFGEIRGSSAAVVHTDLNPGYLYAFSPKELLIRPYLSSTIRGRPEVRIPEETLIADLERGGRVFSVFSGESVEALRSGLPTPEGFEWRFDPESRIKTSGLFSRDGSPIVVGIGELTAE